MIVLGLILTLASALVLLLISLRAKKCYRIGYTGWLGLGLIGTGLLVLALPLPELVFLGSLIWSGYLLLVDSAVFSLRGQSLMRTGP